jgi:hypothetical protein
MPKKMVDKKGKPWYIGILGEGLKILYRNGLGYIKGLVGSSLQEVPAGSLFLSKRRC